jgi:uncharacterized protein
MTWREELDNYIRREANPPYKYAHQPRLYALTLLIAQNSTPPLLYDDDVVYAAAFLHDLGVFIGHRTEDPALLPSWDHVAYVCDHAPALLTEFGFPTHKIAHVIACMEQHMPKDEPQSIEATLLRDADLLEQLGAIGILRTAAKLDSDTRFHQFSDVQRALQRSLEILPGKIMLDATRNLAVPRIRVLQDFMEALHKEAATHLDE